MTDNIDLNEYTLVDLFTYNGDTIYCYLGDDDYVFTIKKDEKEVIITDKDLIKKIKEENYLDVPEVLYYRPEILLIAKDASDIDNGNKEKMIENFINLLSNTKIPLDIESIKKRLLKVSFVYGEPRKDSTDGFYHPMTNTIVLQKDGSYDTAIHELIHACGGSIFNFTTMAGLIEGSTELTARRIIGDIDNHGTIFGSLRANANLGSYPHQCMLIAQMEYIINYKVTTSIVLGRTDFFDYFKNKYSKNLYRTVLHSATKIINLESKGKGSEAKQLFMNTQNTLLKTAFDIDFDKVKDVKTAEMYMSKLKGFEYFICEDLKSEKNNIFSKYYNEQLIKIISLLARNNVDKNIISDFENKYAYKKTEQNRVYAGEEEKGRIIADVGSYLARYLHDNNIKINFDNVRIYAGYNPDNDDSYHLVTYEGKLLLYYARLVRQAKKADLRFGKYITPDLLDKLLIVDQEIIIRLDDATIRAKYVEDEKIYKAALEMTLNVLKKNGYSEDVFYEEDKKVI